MLWTCMKYTRREIENFIGQSMIYPFRKIYQPFEFTNFFMLNRIIRGRHAKSFRFSFCFCFFVDRERIRWSSSTEIYMRAYVKKKIYKGINVCVIIYKHIYSETLYRWKNCVTHNVRPRVYAWDFTTAYLWPTFLAEATLDFFSISCHFLIAFLSSCSLTRSFW